MAELAYPGDRAPQSRIITFKLSFKRLSTLGRIAIVKQRDINMTYDDYNEFCRDLPATTYTMQWGNAHVWKVGGKVFAIGGWETSNTPAFTFKTSQLTFEILQEQSGFRPAPYLASRGMTWIQLYDPSDISDEAIQSYLQESHYIVSLGLTKKKQRQLGLNQT